MAKRLELLAVMPVLLVHFSQRLGRPADDQREEEDAGSAADDRVDRLGEGVRDAILSERRCHAPVNRVPPRLEVASFREEGRRNPLVLGVDRVFLSLELANEQPDAPDPVPDEERGEAEAEETQHRRRYDLEHAAGLELANDLRELGHTEDAEDAQHLAEAQQSGDVVEPSQPAVVVRAVDGRYQLQDRPNREAGDEVDEEPAHHVAPCNLARLADQPAFLVVRRAKVDENVDDKGRVGDRREHSVPGVLEGLFEGQLQWRGDDRHGDEQREQPVPQVHHPGLRREDEARPVPLLHQQAGGGAPLHLLLLLLFLSCLQIFQHDLQVIVLVLVVALHEQHVVLVDLVVLRGQSGRLGGCHGGGGGGLVARLAEAGAADGAAGILDEPRLRRTALLDE